MGRLTLEFRVNAWQKAMSLLEIQTLPYFCHPQCTHSISEHKQFVVA